MGILLGVLTGKHIHCQGIFILIIYFRGSACGIRSGANIAIVDMTFVGEGCPAKRSNGLQDSAMTFVHEVGHQLGMQHDHVGSNAGRRDGRDCTGEGHMSYGNTKQEWSSCSKYDFKNWWNSRGYACPHIEHGKIMLHPQSALTLTHCRNNKLWGTQGSFM